MVDQLTLLAPAKLNLFLHITGRRANGYHELQTLFQILDVGDTLEFTRTDSGDIRLTPEFVDLDIEDNLIFKAAKLLAPYREKNAGVDIVIDKKLPMGGGLGGGSSNAATTLLALNTLWKCKLSNNELAALGLSLGADVPVFVHGFTALAEGIGEQLTPVQTPENWYVVLCPETHVSTAQIFSNEVLTRDTPKMKIAPALEGQALDSFHNDCEPLVTQLYPDIQEAIHWLSKHGPAKLTGTGACCFCRVESETKARQVLNSASSKFKGFIAKGVQLSPALKRLNEAERFATNNSQ